jgi:hypothetical protein
VELNGTAEDASVRLEKGSIRADSTPITRESRKEVRIQNRSGVMVKFSWKAVATAEEEEQLLSRLTQSIDEQEDAETDEFARMLEADPLQRTQAAVLRRTYAALRQTARDAPNTCVLTTSIARARTVCVRVCVCVCVCVRARARASPRLLALTCAHACTVSARLKSPRSALYTRCLFAGTTMTCFELSLRVEKSGQILKRWSRSCSPPRRQRSTFAPSSATSLGARRVYR